MIVCVCRRVSDRDIQRAAQGGALTSFAELQDELGVATACGACHDCARDTWTAACGGAPRPCPPVATRRGVIALQSLPAAALAT